MHSSTVVNLLNYIFWQQAFHFRTLKTRIIKNACALELFLKKFVEVESAIIKRLESINFVLIAQYVEN